MPKSGHILEQTVPMIKPDLATVTQDRWTQVIQHQALNKPWFRADPNCITLTPMLGWSWMENSFRCHPDMTGLSHASIMYGFLLILGTCRCFKHFGSDMCTFNSRKFVLFTRVKLMMTMDLFLPVLWHEVGTSFLNVSELWLQGKKPWPDVYRSGF